MPPQPRPPSAVDPTREAAFELLVAVGERRRPLDEALDGLPAMEGRDRAAAHRLAAAVLRREPSLDAVLEPHLRREPPPRVRIVLRMGAAGLLLLGTPPHAAVGTAVDLVRARGLAPFAGLVNALLRRVGEGGAALLDGLDAPRLDTPPWLWASWGARARAIAMAHAHEAPIDLAFRPGAVPAFAEGEALPGGVRRLPPGTRVASLPGYDDGDFFVQDVAAGLPARLLGDVAGKRVCDLCAAPGGKTAQLAFAGAAVTAVDRDARRLARLRENAGRLGIAPAIVEADAVDYAASAPVFDAVLLDAPCSATGTIRRHPDVLRLRRPADLAKVVPAQAALLEAAARLLAPGGTLVYAVCSLQPEEGPAQRDRAVASGLWRHHPLDPTVLDPAFAPCLTPEGDLRTDPAIWSERGGMDGFFATRLVRA